MAGANEMEAVMAKEMARWQEESGGQTARHNEPHLKCIIRCSRHLCGENAASVPLPFIPLDPIHCAPPFFTFPPASVSLFPPLLPLRRIVGHHWNPKYAHSIIVFVFFNGDSLPAPRHPSISFHLTWGLGSFSLFPTDQPSVSVESSWLLFLVVELLLPHNYCH